MTREIYELQRRAHQLQSQPPEVRYSTDGIEELARIAAAFEQARAALVATEANPEAVDTGMMLGADTTKLSVTVRVSMRQVPTSMVNLLTPQDTPLVTFDLKNHRTKKARLKITTRVEGFSSEEIDTFELKPGTRSQRAYLPVFALDRLAEVTEARAACLYVRVDDLDSKLIECEQTYRIMLLPRTTAYLRLTNAAGGEIDLTRYLGAWVTPNAPEIMRLVREAAALVPSGKIVGYQAPMEEEMPGIVDAQVDAIYQALQARKLSYVSSTIAFNLAGDTFVQRIRLPREALALGSANCIDGVVLMASALEAASLNPAIVIIPTHAFLAYERIPYSGQWDYVETTLLDSGSFAEAQRAARAIAESFLRRGSSRLTMWSIPKLRAEHAIFPME
jgi:hypothetical protein